MSRIKFGPVHSYLFELIFLSTRGFTYRTFILKLLGLSKTPAWHRMVPLQKWPIYQKNKARQSTPGNGLVSENKFRSNPINDSSVHEECNSDSGVGRLIEPYMHHFVVKKNAVITGMTSGLEKMLMSEMQPGNLSPEFVSKLNDTTSDSERCSSFLYLSDRKTSFKQNIIPIKNNQYLPDVNNTGNQSKSSKIAELTSGLERMLMPVMQPGNLIPDFVSKLDDTTSDSESSSSFIYLSDKRASFKQNIISIIKYNQISPIVKIPSSQPEKSEFTQVQSGLESKLMLQMQPGKLIQKRLHEEYSITKDCPQIIDNVNTVECPDEKGNQDNLFICKSIPVQMTYISGKKNVRASCSNTKHPQSMQNYSNRRVEKQRNVQINNSVSYHCKVLRLHNAISRKCSEFLERHYLFKSLQKIVR